MYPYAKHVYTCTCTCAYMYVSIGDVCISPRRHAGQGLIIIIIKIIIKIIIIIITLQPDKFTYMYTCTLYSACVIYVINC